MIGPPRGQRDSLADADSCTAEVRESGTVILLNCDRVDGHAGQHWDGRVCVYWEPSEEGQFSTAGISHRGGDV